MKHPQLQHESMIYGTLAGGRKDYNFFLSKKALKYIL
jgi:hypothetical protein